MSVRPTTHAFEFLLFLAFVCCLLAPVRADVAAFRESAAYDGGALGSFPVQYYVTSQVKGPHVNFAKKSPRCDDGMYTFLSPRGYKVDEPGPTILDGDGNLIWSRHLPGQTYNFMVQEYKGQQYLTYWLGNDAVAGHGSGTYYMLDSSYREVAHFGAAAGLEGDLHEFRLTDAGTAMLTIYQIYPADLSGFPGKSSHGYIWDSLFQEIDLATGSLIFQWRASEHYNITDTYEKITGHGFSEGDAFDWFHINSVEKDDKGNYLVSARYTHSVTYIDGNSGEIIWILGGKRNMFKDLSGGNATNFAWQHDARWHDNFTAITLFDNGAEAGQVTAPYSRGLKLKLDFEAMTVKLETEFIHPLGFASSSQGSVQILPSSNVLVGYGYDSAFTEFSAQGEPLCDVHFGAASRFETGEVQSYRALKYNWVGRPTTSPDAKIENGILYVSWNGATEVVNWVVQDSDRADSKDDNSFWPVAMLPKDGFETRIELGDFDRSVKAYLRVAAVDKDGSILGISRVLSTGAKKVSLGSFLGLDQGVHGSSLRLDNVDTSIIIFFILTIVVFTAAMFAYWLRSVWVAKRGGYDRLTISRPSLDRPGFGFLRWNAVRRSSNDAV